MEKNRVRPVLVFAILLICCLALACTDEREFRLASEPFPTVPGLIYLKAAPGLMSTDPPAPAPPSVVDPHTPWSSLGELSGYYRLKATRLVSDCTRGPDVPFIGPKWPFLLEGMEQEYELWDDTFSGYATQRGNTVSLEIGEGIVFGTWVPQTSRLEDVERIGAEGVTTFVDGFDVEIVEQESGVVRIRGESDWLFEDDYYVPGEVCHGRTYWEAVRRRPPPTEGTRDLQIVLRWPAKSKADLDLILQVAEVESDFEDEHVDFARAKWGCYSLHSVGLAPDGGGFVASFDVTELPYHEEIIRCSYAAYGVWMLRVVNWSAEEVVDYQIEVFSGAGVNTGEYSERSFGARGWTVAPLEEAEHRFYLTPPSTPGGAAGVTVTGWNARPLPAARPTGALTGTFLEFNKAAWQGLSYLEFIDVLSRTEP